LVDVNSESAIVLIFQTAQTPAFIAHIGTAEMAQRIRSPIQRLLVANRGEIAARIISSALELGLYPIALYTSDDTTHARFAPEAIKLPDAMSYMNAGHIVDLCKEHNIDAVHPGYGFLSESAEFARMAALAGVMVVGPGAELLDRTGDKLRARELAKQCGVAVLPALEKPTKDIAVVRSFVSRVGYPIMIKAVDGGGGRGIRLVKEEKDLDSAVTRAVEESPSKLVFAEKAAVDGYLHIEIQIVGDGTGNVMHLLERQCSIQRRYQKVVEIAPCVNVDRSFVANIIESAVGIARRASH
jgi:pyruvate carboxylase